MFDVTARLLTGTTGITMLTQAFSLDERKATKRMYVNAINHNSERKCPSCSEQKETMHLDYLYAENSNYQEKHG